MIERITMRPSLCWASCLLAALLCVACEEDVQRFRLLLNGRWELAKALRNQKQTETLSGVYFQFGEDNKMLTNFPAGPEEFGAFQLKQREIIQNFPAQMVRYQIKGLNDTSLILTTEMRGSLFELQLRKSQ